MEALNEKEYLSLFDLIKCSLNVVMSYRQVSIHNAKFAALHRAQRILSHGHHWDKKLYQVVRDAKRAVHNPTLSNLYGVKIVNDMIDMIDNISDDRPAVPEESLLELKESISNMTRLNDEAQKVTEKCGVVAGNLNKIKEFIEGERNDMPVVPISTWEKWMGGERKDMPVSIPAPRV